MSIIPQYLSAASALSGFKNYNNSQFSAVITGQTLGTGDAVSVIASTALNNTNSISHVRVQLSGVDSNYYILYGSLTILYDSGNYEIEVMYYFDSTNLYVLVIVSNQSSGSVTIPTITVNCEGFLFIAPF